MSSPLLTLIVTFVLFFGAAFTMPVEIRDVYAPPVMSPHAGTVWKVGARYNVTWDNTHAPKSITNSKGQIFLVTKGLLDIDHPLAANFNILDGKVEITVPKVDSRTDYQIVLFGDSGNSCPKFTITT